ncbi:MAG: YbaN family protein [Candidatus Bipolaricaulia bacterium]
MNKIPNRLIKWALFTAGTFFTGLGILGIFLPLLPTAPFLLLAAACYARSSERFYNWLLNNKWFGNQIRNYLEGKGVSLRSKVSFISLLWITTTFSAVFIAPIFFVKIILILVAFGVTLHLLSIPTLKR